MRSQRPGGEKNFACGNSVQDFAVPFLEKKKRWGKYGLFIKKKTSRVAFHKRTNQGGQGDG